MTVRSGPIGQYPRRQVPGLTAQVGDGGHFPEGAARQGADGVQALGRTAVGVQQAAVVVDLKPQAQGVGPAS